MTDFLIGRQQILDSKLNTFAYEILFRGKNFDLNAYDGATKATNQVITDTLLEIGLNEIVGPHKAFINFTTQNILQKTPLHLPKDRIVIEVLESVTVDADVIDALQEFSREGYTIALDDFILTDEWRPLLDIADIIKLDVKAGKLADTETLIHELEPYGLILLAEKVETLQDFEILKNWGCTLFQGFFFSKPNIVEGKRIGVSQASAVQLLAAVNKTETHFEDIGTIIGRDVALSYKLLRYINSAFFSLPVKVESIQQAIALLGLTELKRWINILTLSSMSEKPAAVLQLALIRGKMCELLAKETGENGDSYFLAGILSCLDSLLDMPIQDIMPQLPISSEIVNAVLHKSGKTGQVLDYVLRYERWEITYTAFQNLNPKHIAGIYLNSINWASRVLSNLD